MRCTMRDADLYHIHPEDGLAWNGSLKVRRFTITRWRADEGVVIADQLIEPETGANFGETLVDAGAGAYIISIRTLKGRHLVDVVIRFQKTRSGFKVTTLGD